MPLSVYKIPTIDLAYNPVMHDIQAAMTTLRHQSSQWYTKFVHKVALNPAVSWCAVTAMLVLLCAGALSDTAAAHLLGMTRALLASMWMFSGIGLLLGLYGLLCGPTALAVTPAPRSWWSLVRDPSLLTVVVTSCLCTVLCTLVLRRYDVAGFTLKTRAQEPGAVEVTDTQSRHILQLIDRSNDSNLVRLEHVVKVRGDQVLHQVSVRAQQHINELHQRVASLDQRVLMQEQRLTKQERAIYEPKESYFTANEARVAKEAKSLRLSKSPRQGPLQVLANGACPARKWPKSGDTVEAHYRMPVSQSRSDKPRMSPGLSARRTYWADAPGSDRSSNVPPRAPTPAALLPSPPAVQVKAEPDSPKVQSQESGKQAAQLALAPPPSPQELKEYLVQGARQDYRRLFIPGRGWVGSRKLQAELNLSDQELRQSVESTPVSSSKEPITVSLDDVVSGKYVASHEASREAQARAAASAPEASASTPPPPENTVDPDITPKAARSPASPNASEAPPDGVTQS